MGELPPPSHDISGQVSIQFGSQHAFVDLGEGGSSVMNLKTKTWLFNLTPAGEVALGLMLLDKSDKYPDEVKQMGAAIYRGALDRALFEHTAKESKQPSQKPRPSFMRVVEGDKK